jgi:hypothetical protein
MTNGVQDTYPAAPPVPGLVQLSTLTGMQVLTMPLTIFSAMKESALNTLDPLFSLRLLV